MMEEKIFQLLCLIHAENLTIINAIGGKRNSAYDLYDSMFGRIVGRNDDNTGNSSDN